MERHRRSGCPIAYSLDVFGDRWTLLILRDMVFGGKRYYREFLEAGEGIATNVLADRLERLEDAGLISKRRDPDDLEIIAWGATYDPASAAPPELAERLKRDREGELAALRKKVIRAMKPEPGPDR
ncbi:MAG: winged helix-turn-helix transcriptional regulator [Planctomycetota bacterium]|jgi:DNA-binding HxlR family transcriptional regulator